MTFSLQPPAAQRGDLAAAEFIAFLLGPQGRAIMAANHQPLFDPVLADRHQNLPASLQALSVPAGTP